MTLNVHRRQLLMGAGIAGAVSAFPGLAFASAPTDQRLVFIIQRGAADGLAIVPPLGDPALRDLRRSIMDEGAAEIDGFFGLHPALGQVRKLFEKGEARAFHALTTGYQDRSHFDGQNVLESGASRPYESTTGWMGRLRQLIPSGGSDAMAISTSVPLALRGRQPVATYAPNRIPDASDDLLLRLTRLYDEDSLLAPLWAEAMNTREIAGDLGGNNGRNGRQLGELAARLLAPADGARMMMLETGGWDTHSNQQGRLAGQLAGLDQLITGLRDGLGKDWDKTLVIVATEFGRTVAVNGTRGTDHGTASAALMLGGALPKGSPVVADWPGLSQSSLFQGRDLKPTATFGNVVSDGLAYHYGLERNALNGLFAV